jgi:hypothetical protein
VIPRQSGAHTIQHGPGAVWRRLKGGWGEEGAHVGVSQIFVLVDMAPWLRQPLARTPCSIQTYYPRIRKAVGTPLARTDANKT